MFLNDLNIDTRSAACGADTLWDDRWRQLSHNVADLFFSANFWVALIILVFALTLSIRSKDHQSVLSRSLLVMTLFLIGNYFTIAGLGRHAALDNPLLLSIGAFFLLGTWMAYSRLLGKR
ncbi:MAG: hypothetical protein ACLPX9_00630 [Rhodomicrobium sp.]